MPLKCLFFWTFCKALRFTEKLQKQDREISQTSHWTSSNGNMLIVTKLSELRHWHCSIPSAWQFQESWSAVLHTVRPFRSVWRLSVMARRYDSGQSSTEVLVLLASCRGVCDVSAFYWWRSPCHVVKVPDTRLLLWKSTTFPFPVTRSSVTSAQLNSTRLRKKYERMCDHREMPKQQK